VHRQLWGSASAGPSQVFASTADESEVGYVTTDGTDLDAFTFVPNSFVDQNLSL
jgi:hypothetical protein